MGWDRIHTHSFCQVRGGSREAPTQPVRRAKPRRAARGTAWFGAPCLERGRPFTARGMAIGEALNAKRAANMSYENHSTLELRDRPFALGCRKAVRGEAHRAHVSVVLLTKAATNPNCACMHSLARNSRVRTENLRSHLSRRPAWVDGEARCASLERCRPSPRGVER